MISTPIIDTLIFVIGGIICFALGINLVRTSFSKIVRKKTSVSKEEQKRIVYLFRIIGWIVIGLGLVAESIFIYASFL